MLSEHMDAVFFFWSRNPTVKHVGGGGIMLWGTWNLV